jgi:hypothetical protein
MEIGGFSSNGMDSYSVRESMKRPSEEEIEKLNTSLSEEIAEKLIEENDENGDGVLSAEELGLSDETFAALETDSESFATAEELANYIKTKIGEKMEEKKPPEGEEPPAGPPPTGEAPNGAGGPAAMISEILDEMGISDEDTETIMEMLQTTSVDVEV